MPSGTQQTQPYTTTNYNSMVAATYKQNIDANTAIASNPAGAMYVYPNNPAALSVVVDPAFNIPQSGTTPFLLNGAASPVTVTLTAPGSNSYYGCVYWDLSTSTAGVVYGATGVSPTPILPDQAWRVPLALVLIANGASTISAANIFDVRATILQPYIPGCVDLGTVSTSPAAVNCFGADSVVIHVVCTAATTITLTLNNFQVGARFTIVMGTTTATVTYKIVANTPGGTACAVTGITQINTTVNMVTTGTVPTAGQSVFFGGSSLLVGSTPTLYGVIT
jgi:hypothetical protein